MNTIRKFREQKGWTQAQLAEKCGVVKSAVSMWETGDRMPDIIMLKKLSQIFGCSADALLENVEKIKKEA